MRHPQCPKPEHSRENTKTPGWSPLWYTHLHGTCSWRTSSVRRSMYRTLKSHFHEKITENINNRKSCKAQLFLYFCEGVAQSWRAPRPGIAFTPQKLWALLSLQKRALISTRSATAKARLILPSLTGSSCLISAQKLTETFTSSKINENFYTFQN